MTAYPFDATKAALDTGPPPTPAQIGALKVYAARLGVEFVRPATSGGAANLLGELAVRMYSRSMGQASAEKGQPPVLPGMPPAEPEAPHSPARGEAAQDPGWRGTVASAALAGQELDMEASHHRDPETEPLIMAWDDAVDAYGSLLREADKLNIDIGPWQSEPGWTGFDYAAQRIRLQIAVDGQSRKQGRLV